MKYQEQLEKRSKELKIDRDELEKALSKFMMMLTDDELISFVNDINNQSSGCCSGSCSCSSCSCC